MEIRKIERGDHQEMRRLYAYCYNRPTETLDPPQAQGESGVQPPPPFRDCWGVFDKGRLMSAMGSYAQRVFHDGDSVPNAGIGGVATFPEYRRQGHVRKLFAHLFPQMRDLGQAFSSLYPFSFAYYRLFGYELAYSSAKWKVPASELALRDDGGTMELVTEPNAEVEALYRDFARPRNLAMDRSPADWAKRISNVPHKTQSFYYLCRDRNGAPIACFQFKAEDHEYHNIDLVIQDTAWRGSEGLSALLSRAALFHPRALTAQFHLPSDVPLDARIADPYTIERNIRATLMVRIVDAEIALRSTRFPGRGSLRIGIRDDVLDWNQGAFQVEWDAGETKVSRAKASRTTTSGSMAEAELSLDVRTLAPLLVGYLGGEDLVDQGLADSSLSRDTLASIFNRKALWQNDGF